MEQAERCIKDMPTQWPDAYAKLSDSYDLNALAAELQDKRQKSTCRSPTPTASCRRTPNIWGWMRST